MVFPSVIVRAELILNGSHFLLIGMVGNLIVRCAMARLVVILIVKVVVVVCVQAAYKVTGLVV